MRVIYNNDEFELVDNVDSNIKKHDIFESNINVEDTIEFKPEEFEEKADISRLELEKTIDLGGKSNE